MQKKRKKTIAKYTTQLRTICETYAGLDERGGYNDEEDIIQKAIPKLFDFEFPIYDENYRNVLETKIVRHYYMDEIGMETVGLFKHYLKTRLNEVMPYFNKLYNSELLEFNPLYDVDLTTDHQKGTQGNNDTTTASKSTGTNEYTRNLKDAEETGTDTTDWTYNNDTPQGGISGLDSLDYLTSATKNTADDKTTRTLNQTGTESRNTTDNTDSDTSATYKDTEDYLEHVKGKTGGASYSERLKEYRETFLNIDMQVIDSLQDLFMEIW